MDHSIQKTADDALRAKAAAVQAGYYDDSLVVALVSAVSWKQTPLQVQPIIKRGTHARVACMDRAITSFLNLFDTATTSPQVVVLGAGKDTTFFRLQQSIPETGRWYEVDFETVIKEKVCLMERTTSAFRSRVRRRTELGGIEMASSEVGATWKGSYYLVPHDLRSNVQTLVDKLISCGFVQGEPTLCVIECSLMYMPEISSRALLSGLVKSFHDSLYLCMYEPILGSDQFGKMMEQNLMNARVASSDTSLVQTRTLQCQLNKLKDCGFKRAVGCDMWAAYETIVTPEQRRRANASEFLDEMEEWVIIMQHYCLVVATSSATKHGDEFCAVGVSSPVGFVPEKSEQL